MINIIYNKSVSSTNDLALKCEEPWSIFIAEEQTKGRGQKGSSWESEPGKNLTFSLVIKPDFVRVADQFYISKIVSLAIIEALEDLDISAKIKWPNDIYVADKKICGILIENNITSSGSILKSVVGIGLNVNQELFISDAPNPISIYQIKGEEQNRNELLNNFALHLTKLYELLSLEELERIDHDYLKHLYRLNESYTYKDSAATFTGRIIDVEPAGVLIIERDDMTTSKYLFKEVEFIHK